MSLRGKERAEVSEGVAPARRVRAHRRVVGGAQFPQGRYVKIPQDDTTFTTNLQHNTPAARPEKHTPAFLPNADDKYRNLRDADAFLSCEYK
jgi:hypothetical protein